MSTQRLAPVRQGMRRLKTLPVFPTLLTAGNLAAGITAILCAANDWLFWGGVMIFVAMVCDMFDGKVARLTKQSGPFGAELDSLSDVVSFGVAPAILVHRLVLGQPGVFDPGQRVLWFITVFYPVMAAIRLARYNVEHAGPGSEEGGGAFRGIPSPGAAAVVASLVIFHQHVTDVGPWLGSVHQMRDYSTLLDSLDWFRWLLLGVTFAAALLMVSTIRYPHVGSQLLGRLSFRKFIVLLLLGALFVWYPAHFLVVGTLGYLLFGVVLGAWRALRDWQEGRSVLDDEDEAAAEDAGLTGEQAKDDVGPAPGR